MTSQPPLPDVWRMQTEPYIDSGGLAWTSMANHKAKRLDLQCAGLPVASLPFQGSYWAAADVIFNTNLEPHTMKSFCIPCSLDIAELGGFIDPLGSLWEMRPRERYTMGWPKNYDIVRDGVVVDRIDVHGANLNVAGRIKATVMDEIALHQPANPPRCIYDVVLAGYTDEMMGEEYRLECRSRCWVLIGPAGEEEFPNTVDVAERIMNRLGLAGTKHPRSGQIPKTHLNLGWLAGDRRLEPEHWRAQDQKRLLAKGLCADPKAPGTGGRATRDSQATSGGQATSDSQATLHKSQGSAWDELANILG